MSGDRKENIMAKREGYTIDPNAPKYLEQGDGQDANINQNLWYDFSKSGIADFANKPSQGSGSLNELESPEYQSSLAAYNDGVWKTMAEKGWSVKGTGNDESGNYQWIEDKDGNVVGKEQGFAGDGEFFKQAASLMAMAATGGGLGTSLGNSMGLTGSLATGVGNGLISVGSTAATGGDWKQALLSTAGSLATTGIGSMVGVNNLNPQLAAAMQGGIRSAVKGDDFLTGAIQGGVNSFISTGNPALDSILKTVVGKQIPKILD
jgi:hypothetical protein